jgi:signal transduction histidine kinase/CheY-like chemotaxis protein/HAMP domain-containing protein
MGLHQKAILFLACLGILWSIAIATTSYYFWQSHTTDQALSEAKSLADRTVEIFLVPTRQFHEEFLRAKNTEEKENSLKQWSKANFAIDEAVIYNFGDDKPHVQLSGDKKIFGIAPLGKNTILRTPFEFEAARQLAAGKEYFEQISDTHIQIAYPLRSSLHPGCAECHIATIEGLDANTNRDVLLGSLNITIPLASAREHTLAYTALTFGVATGLFLLTMVLFYFFLDRVVLRRLKQCAQAIHSLAHQNYDTHCPVQSHDEIGMMAKAINHTVANVQRVFKDKVFFYESILDSIPSPVVAIDPDHKILYLNRSARELSDTAEVGQPCDSLMPCDCETEACLLELAENNGKFENGQNLIQFSSKPGHEYSVKMAKLLNRANDSVGFVEVLHDITQLRSMESDLKRAKEAAEAASQAKSDFLAKMSHEIRTPMTAILGYAEILDNRETTPLETFEAVHSILSNGQHLLEIINTILDLARIESGYTHVNKKPFDTRKLIDEVVSQVKVKAKEKQLDLSAEIDDQAPESLTTDPLMVRQILTNLLGNAIKFTEAGQIRVKVNKITKTDDKNQLEIQVSDEGIGIAADQIEKIFEPFHQADDTTKRIFTGTGLGLAISRKYTKLLGGDLRVNSQIHKGSTFTLSLPIETPVSQPTVEKSPQTIGESMATNEGAFAELSVLMAEDGVDNRRLVSLFLKKTGINLTMVENGQEAINEVISRDSENQFDLILMDMQMPIVDGYTATRELRSRHYNRPIVAFTAHSMKHEKQKCLEAGCDDYLTKPFTKKSLLKILAKYLLSPAKTGH